MKIALVDVDSHNFPNLVLMKLSAWHKNRGDEVTLMSAERALHEENLIFKYDKIYGACVFSGQEEILSELEKRGVHLGGTGTRYREIFNEKSPPTVCRRAFVIVCMKFYVKFLAKFKNRPILLAVLRSNGKTP